MNKPKVLFVTESRNLSSGFGTYAKEILPRIYNSNKFEIAEFVCYAGPQDFKSNDWLVYNNAYVFGKEAEEHGSNPLVQWGMKRFERVVLDFKPDVVCTYRDPWMDRYIGDSPFLPFFEWIWMPTVDSNPQRAEWISIFNKCSDLLAYSHYGKNILEKQTNGRLKVSGIPSPAMENVFHMIQDKEEHKSSFGIGPNSIIFGTVMRNQKRKMFAELMRTFKNYLNSCDKETYERSFLYLHTSFPEKIGWDIANLAHEFGLTNKILTTYICRKCKNVTARHFQDALAFCDSCKIKSCVMPTVSNGLTTKDLSNIYNLFDTYIQYAICEGFGMPVVEAAACGIPLIVINYTSMEDFVNYLDATPIDPIPIRELETNADRSGPNNEHLLKIMIDFSKKSKEEIESMREKTNYLCHKNYSWDKAAGIWIDAIEKSLEKKKPFHGKWDIGPIIKENSVDNPPKNLNNFAFTEWIYSNFVQDGNEMYNYEMIDTIKELNFGATKKGAKLEMCDQNSILKYFIESIYLRKLNYDKLRCGIITEKSLPEFISEAHKGFNKE